MHIGAPVTSTALQLENPATSGAGGQLGGAESPATWLEASGATVAVGLGVGVVEGARECVLPGAGRCGARQHAPSSVE